MNRMERAAAAADIERLTLGADVAPAGTVEAALVDICVCATEACASTTYLSEDRAGLVLLPGASSAELLAIRHSR